MTASDGRLVGDLAKAIDESDFAWSLVLVGEDQRDKLAALTGDLLGKPSSNGDGKQITSGYAYWGIGPTIAWAHACADPFYLVMKQSLDSFTRRWGRVRGRVGEGFHHVSFGVGTGHKDRLILEHLLEHNQDLLYLPVDMSSEMLRLGTREATHRVGPRGHRVVPVQLDFSITDNLAELRDLVHRLVGDEPVLYSLLGNTLANFDHDDELLANLTALARPQDRFLLEVATTEALSDDLARDAVEEYSRSRAYREFVTSALLHNTDLTITVDAVQFRGSVEGDRALKVKVVYQNQTGDDILMMLPDRTRVAFPDRDTIRLYLTRKYARRALDGIVRAAGMRKVTGTHSDFAVPRSAQGFGMDLLLLAPGDPVPAPRPDDDVARVIWEN
ncbi:putative SAM-dependent methyltransferase [Saccharothrix saharensis]|uniref:Putative SAM-dependent methyltransferase n=1 Tax=Saccharothrix saharensis TaxID=571190 RepID=A0A543JA71_9PSEU|nr:L-histidine N(alpha)-methyltransferase [Saccharothrix saharensis]TQM79719.1 putative SAM-dependent methyltransferase [Saccharothrix saharensis]